MWAGGGQRFVSAMEWCRFRTGGSAVHLGTNPPRPPHAQVDDPGDCAGLTFAKPVSSIMGVGATRRSCAVKWIVVARMAWAWVLTIPSTALLAFAIEWLFTLLARR